MQPSEEEIRKQKELFGTLFGYQVGDCVKKLEKRNYGRRGFYWRYGKVTMITNPDKKGERVRVLFNGNPYPRTERIKNLVRCRRYKRGEI